MRFSSFVFQQKVNHRLLSAFLFDYKILGASQRERLGYECQPQGHLNCLPLKKNATGNIQGLSGSHLNESVYIIMQAVNHT